MRFELNRKAYKPKTKLIHFDYANDFYSTHKNIKTNHTMISNQRLSNCASGATLQQTVTLSKEITTSNTMTFSKETTMGLGVETEFSVGVPFVGETDVSTKFEWSTSSSSDTSTTASEVQKIEIQAQVTVGPKKCVEVDAWTDIIDPTDPLNVVPFTATMTAEATGPIQQFDGTTLQD